MDYFDLKTRFEYHPPRAEDISKFELIRAKAKEFSFILDAQVPDSREKSLAITKLEEVVMWANAGIARCGAVKTAKE